MGKHEVLWYICHEIYTGKQASFGRCAIIFYSEFYKQLSLTQTLHSLRLSDQPPIIYKRIKSSTTLIINIMSIVLAVPYNVISIY